MNRDPAEKFESLVDGIVRSVNAGPRRRRRMREELLGHLWQAYDQERALGQSESDAFDAVIRRFGSPDELQRLLQGTVSAFERWLAQWVDQMEVAMSMGPRFLGWVLAGVGAVFAFGLAVVMPATARLAEVTSASPQAAHVLEAEQILKASLISLVAFSFLVTLAGLSILTYAFFTRKRTAQ